MLRLAAALSAVTVVVLVTAGAVGAVPAHAAPLGSLTLAAPLGSLTLAPASGTVTGNPMLSATTSAACPAGFGTNAALKVLKVGTTELHNLAQVGSAGDYDRAAFTLAANRSMTAAYGGVPPADGDYQIAVICTSETQGDNPNLFVATITVTAGSWQLKPGGPGDPGDPGSPSSPPPSGGTGGNEVTVTTDIAPSPTPAGNGGGFLPKTGLPIAAVAALGAVLVAAGAGLVWAVRRRRAS